MPPDPMEPDGEGKPHTSPGRVRQGEALPNPAYDTQTFQGSEEPHLPAKMMPYGLVLASGGARRTVKLVIPR